MWGFDLSECLEILRGIPDRLVRQVIDRREDNTVRGGHDELRSTGGEADKHAGREQNKKKCEEDTHVDVHLLYSSVRFYLRVRKLRVRKRRVRKLRLSSGGSPRPHPPPPLNAPLPPRIRARAGQASQPASLRFPHHPYHSRRPRHLQ